MATVIAIAFGVLLIYAIAITVDKRKAARKDTRFKDGEIPKQNPK